MTEIPTWPLLPYDAWQDTCATLQLWTQLVGKIRLAKAPMTNHWWQVPLYVTCRGLTTSPIPDNEFVLPYDAVCQAAAPDQFVLEFLESTYAAAADLGHWDRAALER